MMVQHKPSKYDKRIREEITNHLVRAFSFGDINFSWVYTVAPITIIDEITEKYLAAIELSERYDGWERPWTFLRGEMRFEYGTIYIQNILSHVAEFYEFMYTRCMTCEEHTPCQYCDMEPKDIRRCIERENDKFWADAAAPSWEE